MQTVKKFKLVPLTSVVGATVEAESVKWDEPYIAPSGKKTIYMVSRITKDGDVEHVLNADRIGRASDPKSTLKHVILPNCDVIADSYYHIVILQALVDEGREAESGRQLADYLLYLSYKDASRIDGSAFNVREVEPIYPKDLIFFPIRYEVA